MALWVSAFTTALYSTHLGRWRGRGSRGAAELKRQLVSGDRKEGGKRTGEGAGRAKPGMTRLASGQRDPEKSLSLLTPGKCCTEASGSRGALHVQCRKCTSSLLPGWLPLESFSDVLGEVVTIVVSPSVCLSWPRAQLLIELLVTSSVSPRMHTSISAKPKTPVPVTVHPFEVVNYPLILGDLHADVLCPPFIVCVFAWF